MDYLEILGIAVALAMDAFSVSIAAGVIIERPGFRHYFRLAFHFGLFQFMMPLIGYSGGMFIEKFIRDYDHWVALALLGYIGLRMVRESFTENDAPRLKVDPSRGWYLLMLSVATSIDALAVGLSLGVLNRPIIAPSVIIGLVCALFSVAGVALGRKAGPLLGRRVERIGGLILIAIGMKIVIDHLC